MNDARPPLAIWLKQNAALSILALAHLPFLIVYFAGLWQLEHYQFFPFALVAFTLPGVIGNEFSSPGQGFWQSVWTFCCF